MLLVQREKYITYDVILLAQREKGSGMSIAITTDDGVSTDELRSLRNWLSGEPELHGRVSLVEQPPSPDKLGALLDALSVAVASGGALSVLASAIVVWLRNRTSDVTLHISNGRRHVKLQSKRIRGMTATDVQNLIVETVEVLGSTEPK